ncbi:MAG: lysoplasmalogenase [Hellea sp.]
MVVSLFLYGLIVLALLMAELKENERVQAIIKPIAALGFILLAIYFGALETKYGKIILAGLVVCAVGDVFLLSRKSETLFKAGMAAFAIGHILYIIAFSNIKVISLPDDVDSIIGLGAVLPVLFGLYITKKTPKSMQRPVLYYCVIIYIMVFSSLLIPRTSPFIFATIAAIMFAISDMFVARDRFITPNPKNALAITPLYFGAQALFALSTQTLGA